MAETGGGAATAAGIDFQQRLGAFVIANAICSMPTTIALQLPLASKISAIQFESKEIVDDLLVHTTHGDRIFIQAKRTLSFSIAADSVLAKVIGDFVNNARRYTDDKIFQLLAVSPECSGTIRHDLKQVLEMHRVSSTLHPYQPPNRRHEDVYQGLAKILERHSHNDAPKKSAEILNGIFVREYPVEADSSQEHAILIALAQKFGDRSDLIWAAINADALKFSRARAIVDVNAYESELRSRTGTIAGGKSKKVRVRSSGPLKGWREVFEGRTPAAMEFLVGKLFEGPQHIEELSVGCGDDKLVIMELFRFDDDCSKKVRIIGDRCYLRNGYELELICRSGTLAGVERFLKSSSKPVTSKKLVFMHANRDEADPEDQSCAASYRKTLDALIEGQTGNANCFACGKPLFFGSKLLVEVDEQDKPLTIGIVHDNCYRVPMRILGEMRLPLGDRFPNLGNFDIERWLGGLATGQGCSQQIAETQRIAPGSSLLLHWGGVKIDRVGANWMLRLDLDNGSYEHAFDRGRLHRMTKAHAERFASRINQGITDRKKSGNEFGYIIERRFFGTKKLLEETKAPSETVCEIVHAEVEPISVVVAQRLDLLDNWYAPICVLVDEDDGSPVSLGFFCFLISDPFEWSRRVPELQERGLLPEQVSFSVLATDAEVDSFLLRMFGKGYRMLIDPSFDADGSVDGTELAPLPDEAEVG